MIKKILIIEDNDAYRNMLKTALEKEDFVIDEAENGRIGCDMCYQNTYDLVIMDLFLPEKDGIQSIYELKEEFSSDIKIIAISGISKDGIDFVFNQSLDNGADATLKKPFKISKLIKTIETLQKTTS